MRSHFTSAVAASAYWARKRNRMQTALIDDDYAPAWGTILFAANPSAGHTITINGTVITFNTTVTIGATLAATLAAVLTYLAAHPVSGASVSLSGDGLLILSTTSADTSVTISASNATVSHATLQKQQINARVPLVAAPVEDEPEPPAAADVLDNRDFTTANWHPESGGLPTIAVESGTLRHDATGGAQRLTVLGSATLFGFGTGTGLWQLAKGYSASGAVANPTFWFKRISTDGHLYVADLNGTAWAFDISAIDPGWQLISSAHPALLGGPGPDLKTIQFSGPFEAFAPIFGFDVGDIAAGFTLTGQSLTEEAVSFYLDDVHVLE